MKTIDGQIYESCLKMGDKAAFQQKIGNIWQSFSYRSLWTESEQITSGLQKSGIKKDDRGAILAVPSCR